MPFSRKRVEPTGRKRVVAGNRPQVFSYHANRSEQAYNLGRSEPRDQDVRRRQRLLKELRQRFGMLFAAIALIVCVFYVLLLSSSVKIVALTGTTNDYFLRSTKTYQAAATRLFRSSILNGNKLTVDTQKITFEMKRQFPELSDVSIALPIMSHRPVVYVSPTAPAIILSTSNVSYVLDTNGRALIDDSKVADPAKLQVPTVTDQSGQPVKLGEVVLSGDTVQFIRTVLAQLQAKSIGVDSLTLPANAAYELDVKPKGVGYFVKFNLHSNNPLQQAGTYLAVRARLDQQNIRPDSYIDVRLDGRAYYK